MSQSGIVSLAKILLVVSLFAYLLARLELTPKRYASFRRRLDANWWIPINNEIQKTYDSMNPEEQDQREYQKFRKENADWDDQLYEERYQRKQQRLAILKFYQPIANTRAFIINVIWPFSLAYIAFYSPEFALIFAD